MCFCNWFCECLCAGNWKGMFLLSFFLYNFPSLPPHHFVILLLGNPRIDTCYCPKELSIGDFNQILGVMTSFCPVLLSCLIICYFDNSLQIGALHVDRLDFSDHHLFQIKVNLFSPMAYGFTFMLTFTIISTRTRNMAWHCLITQVQGIILEVILFVAPFLLFVPTYCGLVLEHVSSLKSKRTTKAFDFFVVFSAPLLD